jgi:hypothetical protein
MDKIGKSIIIAILTISLVRKSSIYSYGNFIHYGFIHKSFLGTTQEKDLVIGGQHSFQNTEY